MLRMVFALLCMFAALISILAHASGKPNPWGWDLLALGIALWLASAIIRYIPWPTQRVSQ